MAKPRFAVSSPDPRALGERPEVCPGLEAMRMAWEFLRRNPRYRADHARFVAGEIQTFPMCWGLVRAIDPKAVDIDVTGIWRPEAGDTPPSISAGAY